MENKGIWHQIQERNKIGVNKDITKKDLIEMFEQMEKSEIAARKKKEKMRKENSEHLIKRIEELGKEIPFELMCYTDPYLNPSCMVGSWFTEKYKEWL